MVSETRPVWSAGTIVAIVTAVIALLVAFGVDISDEQKMAIIGLIGVVAPFASAALTAPKTTPIADPRAEDGEELVRKSSGEPTRAAAARTEKQIQKFRERKV